jgi:hypothetical protein
MIDKIINVQLVSDWRNWIVVWFVATIWILAFHSIVTGFGGSKSQQTFNNGPLPNGNALPAIAPGSVSFGTSVFSGVPTNNSFTG